MPLHWAAFRGHVASVQELVGKGSLVGQMDAEGNTPGSTFHPSVPEVGLVVVEVEVASVDGGSGGGPEVIGGDGDGEAAARLVSIGARVPFFCQGALPDVQDR